MTIWEGAIGVTTNCSRVPNSRSRAMTMLANMAAIAAAMKPSSEGIMKLDSFSSSLNQTRKLMSSGATWPVAKLVVWTEIAWP